MSTAPLAEVDPQVHEAIRREIRRQSLTLQLIASENYVSRAVMEATGSVMTNKYAEGYPGKRYYGGCQYVDVVEELAVSRAKELFGAEFANVQPHAGSQANMAVYFAYLNPGDTVLAMKLAHGGHLTHGSPVSFSGRLYNFVSYGVDEKTETIDYDQVRDLAREHRPRLIVAGASAYPRFFDFETLASIAEEVEAAVMVDIAHIAGLIAGGAHPSPVPHAQFVTSTTHKTLRGPRGGFILARAEFGPAINRQIFPGMQGGPLMHHIAAKAVSFSEASSEEFKAYAHQIVKNAKVLAQVLTEAGFRLVSGGTDNHLVLVDVSTKGLTGAEAEAALDAAGITANKNAIPFDKQPPTVTSGLRMGTPALTTRGLREEEIREVAGMVVEVLANPGSESVRDKVKGRVKELCRSFPIYQDLLES